MMRRVLVVLASLLMLLGWAAPAHSRPAVIQYPTITTLSFTWTPADATGACHNTTMATLSAPVTSTTRVTARWTLTALSSANEVWTYQMWLGSPAVGTATIGPWTMGACSSDGARYTSVRIELFKGTNVKRTAQPYTSKVEAFSPAFVCTAQ